MTSIQIPNNCSIVNSRKPIKLEQRTYLFAKETIRYCKVLSRDIAHFEIAKQLIRSAGSVGANYIEANEALSKKDFIMRIKICRKEAKESEYWLRLTTPLEMNAHTRDALIQEATELRKIFSSILLKCL